MFGIAALVSFIVAAVIFVIGWHDVLTNGRLAAGLFFIALGLALSMLDPAVVLVRKRQVP